MLITSTMEFTLPIYMEIEKKTKKNQNIMLGLNWLRNAHHFISNKIKHEFQELVLSQINSSVKYRKMNVIYKVYLKRTNADGGNVRSVVEKFFLDALVKGGVIEDDSCEFVIGDSSVYAVDKENPRVEIIVHGEEL